MLSTVVQVYPQKQQQRVFLETLHHRIFSDTANRRAAHTTQKNEGVIRSFS